MVLSNSYCNSTKNPDIAKTDDFNYFVEQFDDIRVLKYKLPGFEELTIEQKIYIYFLSQAALSGRGYLMGSELQV